MNLWCAGEVAAQRWFVSAPAVPNGY